ncbi:MAG: hypothetical protein E5W63_12420, partial [Mesorhizobium sp.]
MDGYDESMFDDLAFDEAEGPADSYDEFDEMDEGDGFEGADEGDEGDDFDEGDDDGWDQALGFALAAEDSDEFFRRIARGIRGAVRTVRRAAPTIGRIARAVAPVASLIPGYGT